MPTTPAPVDDRLLARFVPMSALSQNHLRELGHHATFLELAPGDILREELERVESILYLVDGVLCLTGGGLPDELVKASDPGSRFALKGAETDGRHARAVERSRLLRVDRAKISTLLIWAQASQPRTGERDPERLQADITALLLQSPLFERIPPSSIERVGELIEPVRFEAGDTVVRQGDPGDYYYVIESGRCEVLREREGGGEPLRLAELGNGECFGEEALLTDSRRNATVRMITGGTLLRLTREYFVDLISAPLVQDVSHERAEDLVATGARWLDVRLPEEFERDGLEGAINVPLAELRRRAGELPPGGSYVTYCNTGRRAQAGAFLLSQRGVHVSCLRDGIARRRPVSREPRAARESLPALQAALARVNAELDLALERKAEADAARDVEARRLGRSQAESDAEQHLHRLTEQSQKASEALRAAVEGKRELEARVRDAEADAASRRRAAQAEVERMRQEAQARLETEKSRLSTRYREASDRLREIEQARAEAEARFEEERRRIERELTEARARMEEEAARIRAGIESARKEAETRAESIRSEHSSHEQRLRRETEESLREERVRLEEEFAMSIAAQEKARHELDLAEAARVEAEQESARLRREVDDATRQRREEEAARREEEVRRLREEEESTRTRLDGALAAHEVAKARHKSVAATLTDLEGGDDRAKQAALRDELKTFEAQLASAGDALAEAREAHESAATAQSIAEETAATARTRAEELRLQLYEEMEVWINEEEERSREELERTAHYARELERIQAEKQRKHAAEQEATESMLSDIQGLLSGSLSADPLSDLRHSRLVAEEKARLVQRARRAVAEQTERARAAISRGDKGEG